MRPPRSLRLPPVSQSAPQQENQYAKVWSVRTIYVLMSDILLSAGGGVNRSFVVLLDFVGKATILKLEAVVEMPW